MSWLALSVLASLFLALVARWGESAHQDRIAMMAWNYGVATVLTGGAAWFTGAAPPDGLTLFLGIVAGISYAAALLFWMVAIPLAGLGLSTTAMRLSVIWPALVAVAAYGERPSPLQSTGIMLALLAVALLLRAGGGGTALRGRSALWLGALWMSSGLNALLLKVFVASGRAPQQPAFLALIFASAGVLCWALVILRPRTWRRGDALRGSLFGAANVASNAFLLQALAILPAVVVFPVRDAGIIATVSLTGVVFLRERPNRWGYGAIGASALAVVCMSA